MLFQADRELVSNGKPPEKLKAAGSVLMKVFGVLAVCFSLFSFLSFDLKWFPLYFRMKHFGSFGLRLADCFCLFIFLILH